MKAFSLKSYRMCESSGTLDPPSFFWPYFFGSISRPPGMRYPSITSCDFYACNLPLCLLEKVCRSGRRTFRSSFGSFLGGTRSSHIGEANYFYFFASLSPVGKHADHRFLRVQIFVPFFEYLFVCGLPNFICHKLFDHILTYSRVNLTFFKIVINFSNRKRK